MTTFVTPPCPVCGERSQVELEQEKVDRWQGGEHIQRVWPEKTPDEREVLMTGFHPKCWDEAFGGDEDS